MNYPVVLGHEFGGTIAALGDQVQGWSVGDRVVSETAAVIDPGNHFTVRGVVKERLGICVRIRYLKSLMCLSGRCCNSQKGKHHQCGQKDAEHVSGI